MVLLKRLLVAHVIVAGGVGGLNAAIGKFKNEMIKWALKKHKKRTNNTGCLKIQTISTIG